MKVEKSELIHIASIVVGKDYSYEYMAYSGEYLSGNKDQLDELWEYVEELKDYGKIAFYEKYKDCKLY